MINELRPVPTFPHLWADDTGALWYFKDGALRPMNAWTNTAGYLVVSVPGVKAPVYCHRAVYLAFHGEHPPGTITRHKDGVKTNNAPGNLVAGDHRQNTDDRRAHGRRFDGEANPAAKLTERDVYAIRKMSAAGVPQKVMAGMFKVSVHAIRSVVRMRTWRATPADVPAAAGRAGGGGTAALVA
jgi:hypothetical protein